MKNEDVEWFKVVNDTLGSYHLLESKNIKKITNIS